MPLERLLVWLADWLQWSVHLALGLWAVLPPAALPVAILLLRTADQTVSSLRMLAMNQGRTAAASLLGLLQAFLFLGGVLGVLGDLDNAWNIIAFAGGYGVGGAVGITIERWIAPGHAILRVVSTGQGPALVQALRDASVGVTEFPGHGMGGTVTVLLSAVPRRQVGSTRRTILAIDPQAFITAENVRVLQGGWVL